MILGPQKQGPEPLRPAPQETPEEVRTRTPRASVRVLLASVGVVALLGGALVTILDAVAPAPTPDPVPAAASSASAAPTGTYVSQGAGAPVVPVPTTVSGWLETIHPRSATGGIGVVDRPWVVRRESADDAWFWSDGPAAVLSGRQAALPTGTLRTGTKSMEPGAHRLAVVVSPTPDLSPMTCAVRLSANGADLTPRGPMAYLKGGDTSEVVVEGDVPYVVSGTDPVDVTITAWTACHRAGATPAYDAAERWTLLGLDGAPTAGVGKADVGAKTGVGFRLLEADGDGPWKVIKAADVWHKPIPSDRTARPASPWMVSRLAWGTSWDEQIAPPTPETETLQGSVVDLAQPGRRAVPVSASIALDVGQPGTWAVSVAMSSPGRPGALTCRVRADLDGREVLAARPVVAGDAAAVAVGSIDVAKTGKPMLTVVGACRPTGGDGLLLDREGKPVAAEKGVRMQIDVKGPEENRLRAP